jgi:hypothetical protein
MPVPVLLARAGYPHGPLGLPLEIEAQSRGGWRGGVRTSICVDAPAPRERRKRSAAAEAAWAALAAVGPTGWAPPWPASSEQQFPIEGGTLPPRQPLAGEAGEISDIGRRGGSAWGWESLPQVASEEEQQVESWRRHGRETWTQPNAAAQSAQREREKRWGPGTGNRAEFTALSLDGSTMFDRLTRACQRPFV